MTEDNRKQHIRSAVERGEDALKAAEALLQLNLLNDAVARFYYATFYFASALLLSLDVAVTSHRGMTSQFALHVVRAGRMPAHVSKDLKQLQGFREAADYDFEFRFDRAGADEEAERARRLISLLRDELLRGGWLG